MRSHPRQGDGGKSGAIPHVRDDRILPTTRALSLFIVPFLVAASVILYGFPGDTERLFAWTIHPTMTPMVLAAAYAGGAWFFVRVLRETRWAAVRNGFVAVALFAGLLGITTVIHWDRFNHGHVTFWLWAGLYFTTPFLVAAAWFVNERTAAPARADEPRIGPRLRPFVAGVGALGLLQGLVMVLAPAWVIPNWPWLLTPLTCRVIGAVFCLGAAGAIAAVDTRWVSLRLMFEVEFVMLALILVAAVRARSEFHTDRPLTWLLLGGVIIIALGPAALLASRSRGATEAAR